MTAAYALLLQQSFRWHQWEVLIASHGIELDRPAQSAHPQYPEIIYPLNYGFVRNTISSDHQEVDVFAGSSDRGLVGLIATCDYRKGDRELKLLWQCTPREIYLANGFINFDRHKLEGTLVMRYPMGSLW
ncbi:MAG: hypothetical protein OXM02_11005 [Bacteroidota bacterium]|nr:hypothetical protein [Bacteroidota bacterium]MDE2835031.1 hypothetical protein [Bacteroidota bacterium]MDE2956943.1 hypothetical protein [Bacteroidota bacterium]